jgi:hypothetical protein
MSRVTQLVAEIEENLRKIHSPESARAELEYIEYLERCRDKVCIYEKQALANIANEGDWI